MFIVQFIQSAYETFLELFRKWNTGVSTKQLQSNHLIELLLRFSNNILSVIEVASEIYIEEIKIMKREDILSENAVTKTVIHFSMSHASSVFD